MNADCFVQIPAYRDTELVPTLRDLFSQAANPERLRVAVAWQHSKDESLPRSLFRWKNLEILPIPAHESRGPNWARHMLQQKYSGESFTLFLDSHHRFVAGWDKKLRAMYEQLSRKVHKPIITAYLPPYDPLCDPRGRIRELLKIYPLKRTAGLLTHLTGRPLPFPQSYRFPITASFASLHFLFAAGSFNEEIVFDPKIYFFGDEVITGLRAYTFGYDMFHPHRVLGWHSYNRATRVPHWDDHSNWHVQEADSFLRMRKIIKGHLRPKGFLSTIRSIEEYECLISHRLIE